MRRLSRSFGQIVTLPYHLCMKIESKAGILQRFLPAEQINICQLPKVTVFQLEKIYGDGEEASAFIASLIKGVFPALCRLRCINCGASPLCYLRLHCLPRSGRNPASTGGRELMCWLISYEECCYCYCRCYYNFCLHYYYCYYCCYYYCCYYYYWWCYSLSQLLLLRYTYP